MSEGLSRREMIRASAVAGATAWTAPLILDSMTSAAGAVDCTGSAIIITSPIEQDKHANSGGYYDGASPNCVKTPGGNQTTNFGDNGANAPDTYTFVNPFNCGTMIVRLIPTNCNDTKQGYDPNIASMAAVVTQTGGCTCKVIGGTLRRANGTLVPIGGTNGEYSASGPINCPGIGNGANVSLPACEPPSDSQLAIRIQCSNDPNCI